MSKMYQLSFEKPIYELEVRLADLEAESKSKLGVSDEIQRMRREIDGLKRKVFDNLSAWETVLVARHPQRPQTADYVELLLDEFVELHGDRSFGDDRAIVTGFANISDFKVMFIGHQKGRNLKERAECFYGCAHPEGYRKALQKMKLAEKYKLPVVCLIDTPGAYPGIGAEERGQSYTIAKNLMEMARLRTPVVCVVIGEGGSGGALGIGVGDRVAMMEFAYYSVISPEGCSGILWKDSDSSKERAAEALRLTSKDLIKLGVIDEVVPEPLGGAHRDQREAAANVKAVILKFLRELSHIPLDQLVEQRHEKYQQMGVFLEEQSV